MEDGKEMDKAYFATLHSPSDGKVGSVLKVKIQSCLQCCDTYRANVRGSNCA